jgi:hypothetical protein
VQRFNATNVTFTTPVTVRERNRTYQTPSIQIEKLKLSDPVLGLKEGAVFSTKDGKTFKLESFPDAPPGCTKTPDINRNPYNFVGLPKGGPWLDKPEEGAGKHPGHQCWMPGLSHGYIDLKITSRTPIFLPEWVKRDTARDAVRKFYTMKRWIDGKHVNSYAIPGSSLKGALRCMVEALANDRFGVMDDREYYEMPIPYRRRSFRAGQATLVRGVWQVQPMNFDLEGPNNDYASNLLAQPGRHRPRAMTPRVPPVPVLTIPSHVLKKYEENLAHQHYALHYKNWQNQWKENQSTPPSATDREKCKPNYAPALAAKNLDAVLSELHMPTVNRATVNIFYTVTVRAGTTEIDSFGKNVNYLWPAEKSIKDLAGNPNLAGDWFSPETSEKKMGLTEPLGLAERMFGFVSDHDDAKESHPFRGKLRFEPLWGPPTDSVTPLGGAAGIKLAPLTAPKSRAKSRPLYMQGQKSGDKLLSASYSDSMLGAEPLPDPVLRGRKFYWKQRYDETIQGAHPLLEFHKKQEAHAQNQCPPPILPLPKGSDFTTRIHFENLSACEMGALLFALLGNDPVSPEPGTTSVTWNSGKHSIHLGKGKPRGLGVCEVEVSIRWFNPGSVYASLIDSQERTPATREEIGNLRNAFTKWCEKMASPDKPAAEHTPLNQLDHIKDFIQLHTWPENNSVRYYPVQFDQYSWPPVPNNNPGNLPLTERPPAMKTAHGLAP